jgi:hypothetical protein
MPLDPAEDAGQDRMVLLFNEAAAKRQVDDFVPL